MLRATLFHVDAADQGWDASSFCSVSLGSGELEPRDVWLCDDCGGQGLNDRWTCKYCNETGCCHPDLGPPIFDPKLREYSLGLPWVAEQGRVVWGFLDAICTGPWSMAPSSAGTGVSPRIGSAFDVPAGVLLSAVTFMRSRGDWMSTEWGPRGTEEFEYFLVRLTSLGSFAEDFTDGRGSLEPVRCILQPVIKQEDKWWLPTNKSVKRGD